MASPAAPSIEPGSWNLSALFSGMDDPKINQSWETAHSRSDAVVRTYTGKIKSDQCSAEQLLGAIQELEEISVLMSKPANYSHLLYAANSSDPKIGAFLSDQMERASAIRVKLLFVELELQEMPESHFSKIITDPKLKNYEHFLREVRKYEPYKLSEKEEILLEEISNTGSRAWVRLYEELTANHVFHYVDPETSELVSMNEHEVMNLLYDPSRARREAAATGLANGYKEMQRTICFAYNNLMAEKKTTDRMRSYDYAQQSRHLANELTREVVDLVVDQCKASYPLVERYYNLKREILGLPELTHVDRYAPLFPAKKHVSYSEAREVVLDSFGAFSKEMSSRASEFFEKEWIDSAARNGKSGGAFCNYNTPDTHPVILMTYLDSTKDVMTLAHELGHGVHAALSREQSYFNFHGTLPLAELASIFGEMLVFENMLASASPLDQLAMIAEKIEGTFASVHRQVALYSFESRAHDCRRDTGEISPEDFGTMWQEELQQMFGNSIKLGEEHRDFWMIIGHFFFAPFYVYAYAFGELLTFGVYQKAKQAGPSFEKRYIDLLRLGGSLSPDDLMATIDVDLASAEFWKGGIGMIDDLIMRFETLWQQVKGTPELAEAMKSTENSK